MTVTSSWQPEVPTKDSIAVPAKRCRRVTAKSNAITPTDKAALLQSAMEVRQTLRNSLVQVNTLIREVKAQRRQERLVKSTMDSLRKLSLT
jgi:hypothetical protein